MSYCKKLNGELLKQIKANKEIDLNSIETLWYSEANNTSASANRNRYNNTRYNGLNIHSYFFRGTVEFRLLNSTTHAGELKSYIQFCLAMSAWSITNETKISFRDTTQYSPKQKATIMKSVLTNRLKMTGEEFKTARQHLTKYLNETVQAEAANPGHSLHELLGYAS